MSKAAANEKRSKGNMARAVSFMYEPPPGYLDNKKKEEKEEEIRREEERKKKEEEDMKAGRWKKDKIDPFNYQELGKRFPFLKNAPTSDESAKFRAIKHNPMGILVRNVRCARCGNYGHRSGERECPMFAARTQNDAERQIREDPLSVIKPSNYLTDKLVLAHGHDNIIHGGFTADDPSQQIIPDDEAVKSKKKKTHPQNLIKKI